MPLRLLMETDGPLNLRLDNNTEEYEEEEEVEERVCDEVTMLR